jgi:predicted DNA-binding protein
MAQNQVYGVVLPTEIARRARILAAMEGKSRSKLMRDLLESYLTMWELSMTPAPTPPVLAGEAQLFGVRDNGS